MIDSKKIQKIKEGVMRDLKKLHESELMNEEELEECDGGGDGGAIGGGGAAFSAPGASATYDAPAFGKAGNSIIKKKPFTVGEIKENIIRPVVKEYLQKYLK